MNGSLRRFSLDGLTCLVTGASAGIGLELCGVLAGAGADLVAVGRNKGGLAEAAALVGSHGRRCILVEADLAEAAEVERAAAEALAACPVIDILVNNAGISFNRTLVEQSLDEWDRTMAVNLRAPWLMAKALVPGMIERHRGKIINMSSLAGGVGMAEHGAYAASKSGLNGLTTVMTAEWAQHNIQCNAVCPTVTMTTMGKLYWSEPSRLAPMLAKTPAGRVAEPVEVCDLVLFLASPASDMINGQSIFIDGGYSVT